MADDPTTDAAPIADPVAKPWYMSKTIISLGAGIVLALAPKVALLIGIPLPITDTQANEFVAFALTQGFALYGRVSATHVITGSAATAKALNEAAAK